MLLNQVPENTGEIYGPGPVGDFGPTSRYRRKERTAFDDFFGADFGMLQAKSICCSNLGAGNDDFMTTQ